MAWRNPVPWLIDSFPVCVVGSLSLSLSVVVPVLRLLRPPFPRDHFSPGSDWKRESVPPFFASFAMAMLAKAKMGAIKGKAFVGGAPNQTLYVRQPHSQGGDISMEWLHLKGGRPREADGILFYIVHALLYHWLYYIPRWFWRGSPKAHFHRRRQFDMAARTGMGMGMHGIS